MNNKWSVKKEIDLLCNNLFGGHFSSYKLNFIFTFTFPFQIALLIMFDLVIVSKIHQYLKAGDQLAPV